MMGLPHLFHTAGYVPVITAVILVYLGASLTGKYTTVRYAHYVNILYT
jgi:hypothetical protein